MWASAPECVPSQWRHDGPEALADAVGFGAQPGAAHPANHLPLLNLITRLHIQLGEMAIERALPLWAAVLKLNSHPIAACQTS